MSKSVEEHESLSAGLRGRTEALPHDCPVQGGKCYSLNVLVFYGHSATGQFCASFEFEVYDGGGVGGSGTHSWSMPTTYDLLTPGK
ncbi:hypothetical protein EYF80_036142 [Liparis tanakae]|uniref:Uncharacterized protein n=1 Tax=Liparis tanakae TaxID=230148 RepID=A0A4Z2GLF5_9TELE|nr:hypothetical protein EYF80_036142 [Liparis tanakae]